MAPTALPIPLPLTPSTTPSHPALQFYIIYGQKFPKTPEQWKTQPYDELYSADCRIIKTDNSAVEGGEASWEFFRKFYAPFTTPISRDLKSLIIVSDDEKGTHEIHAEFLTKLPVEGGEGVVELPQSFVYVLGEADEGKGLDGLQIRELRNFYDVGVWERAAARQE